MRDKRAVDELSIEELERVLAIRKREERQKRVAQFRTRGRMVDVAPAATPPPAPPAPAPVPPTRQAQSEITVESKSAAPVVVQDAPSSPAPARRKRLPETPEPVFEEELEPAQAAPAPSTKNAAPSGSKRAVNALLLLVEIAAVAGLIFIGVNLFLAMSRLEQETAQAQELANEQRLAGLPTIEPTAILRANIDDFVLPGGHTIDENGAAQFNVAEFIDEVPAHLQTQVISQVFPVDFRPPPTTSETALYVNIPQLGIDQSIFQGTDWETLKKGVGQVLNGANPGDTSGNVVLAAHNDIYGELFRYLDQLKPGDEFYVQTETQTYTYRVTGYKIVEPTDVYVMEDQGRPTVTLISCYPYRVNTQRYVVFAERVEGTGL